MPAPDLSVLVCTHNPRAVFLNDTLAALVAQRGLPAATTWELIIVDNGSTPPLRDRQDLNIPPSAKLIEEPRLGLTHARRRSFRESRSEILVCVDDDNVLAADYLSHALRIMKADERLGGAGGRALPEYETQPPSWFPETGISLACRDLGPAPSLAAWDAGGPKTRTYPECAPIGAGMVLRRAAYAAYVEEAASDPARLALGRKGNDLSSGEDNDMVMTMLKHGWKVAYHPELTLTHLIPAGRLTHEYLRRYAYSSNRTWVQVLGVHGIKPWSAIPRWTSLPRKIRSYLRTQPWKGPAHDIAWASACGLIDGRARLPSPAVADE